MEYETLRPLTFSDLRTYAERREKAWRYYGAPMNSSVLSVSRMEVCRMWYIKLRRRSQKSKWIWERIKRLIAK